MQPLHTEKAEDGLYRRFASTIFAYLSRQVDNREDAEDLLLEVFLQAHKEMMLQSLPEERQLAWLRRVARNKVIDLYRHQRQIRWLPLAQASEREDENLTPEARVEQQEKYARLFQAMKRLPLAQQEVILLRYGKELPFAEIAEILGKPGGTVRKMLARSLHQLRTYYDQMEREKEL